jgi:phosphohistidine phosphatase SixA
MSDRAFRVRVRWFAAVVFLAGAASIAHGQDSVWDAMRAPGAIVVVRHSFAPGSFDPPNAKRDDCSTQRNLDANGRAEAGRIGDAFRQNGIRVGTVLSSPRCRCLDTGRLPFGRAEAWDVLQGSLNDMERRQRQLGAIKSRIAAYSDALPLVLVTHGRVVSDLTGLEVRMGELVVLKRDATGTLVVAGRLYVD